MHQLLNFTHEKHGQEAHRVDSVEGVGDGINECCMEALEDLQHAYV